MLPANDPIGKTDGQNLRAPGAPSVFAIPVAAGAGLFSSKAVGFDDPFSSMVPSDSDQASATIPFPATWDAEDVKRAICPDQVMTLLREWGVKVTGHLRDGIWIECHAIDREDGEPSAAVRRDTGMYKDLGGDGKTLSIFKLAQAVGAFRDFPTAVNSLGERFGVIPKSGIVPPARNSWDSWDSWDSSKAEPKPKAKPEKSSFPKQVWKTLDLAVAAVEKWTGKKAVGSHVQTWAYGDSLAMVRFSKADGQKSYRPFHRDPETKCWACGDPGGLLPLYRLDQLKSSGIVLVLEGEKCCDLAANLGFQVVTSSHGAKSAAKTDWSPLAGRDVVILPDADDAGSVYADTVATILWQLDPATTIRRLDLPGLGPKSGDDFEQWQESQPDQFTQNQVVASLQELIARTPKLERETTVDPNEPTNEELGLVTFSDIPDEPIDWLWDNRFLRGAITLIAGEGEIGKSFLTLDLIARITTGRPFPDQIEPEKGPADCIYITAEDRHGMVIGPRLREAGADLTRVHTIKTGKDKNGKPLPFTIEDIARLEHVMKRKPRTAMIVIDPIASFLGRADENKNAELRRVLGPLSDFAGETNVSIVCIAHFNKSTSGNPASRIIGSVAWINVARSAWCVVADPENDERRLFLRIKNNLSGLKTGLAYTIVEQESKQCKVVWELEPVHMKAADILNQGGNAKKTEKAEVKREKILEVVRTAIIATGLARNKSDDIFAAIKPQGVSRSAFFRLSKEDRDSVVKAVKSSNGEWYWELVEAKQESQESQQSQEF